MSSLGVIAILFLFVIMILNIKIIKIQKKILHYLLMDGIIEFFLLEIFFIINNDYIPIIPKKIEYNLFNIYRLCLYIYIYIYIMLINYKTLIIFLMYLKNTVYP
jgi:hypothetical protein